MRIRQFGRHIEFKMFIVFYVRITHAHQNLSALKFDNLSSTRRNACALFLSYLNKRVVFQYGSQRGVNVFFEPFDQH